MSKAILPPSQTGQVGQVLRRGERMERKPVTAPATLARSVGLPLLFTYHGVLEAGVESPPFYAEQPMRLSVIRVSLLDPADDDVEILARINDGAITQSVTLAGGDVTVAVGVALALAPGDRLSVMVWSVTTDDASDLDVAFVWS